MKMHAGTAAICLLMQLLLQGCGLGTEVGNGVKPHNESDESKKAAASESEPVAQEDAVKKGENDDLEGSDAGSTPTANSTEQPEPGIYDFDVNILLNNCASPFESTYGGKFALSGLTAAGKANAISGMSDADSGSWEVKDTFGKILATISDDSAVDDYKVEVVDANKGALISGYTCNQQVGSEEDGIYTYNFEMTKAGKASLLSWMVDATGTEEKLMSITIKPDTAENTVIKLEAKKD